MAESLAQYFSDFDGFKEAFKRACLSRVLPGWVWLAIGPDGRLLITQTNNEDNPLMHGVVDPPERVPTRTVRLQWDCCNVSCSG